MNKIIVTIALSIGPYCVVDTSTDPPTRIIVRALSRSGAIARLSEPRYSAAALTANECVDLMAAGVKLLGEAGAT